MSEFHEVVLALRPVANAFRELGIRFYVGGSVASSCHGAMRSTMDVDVIADIQQPHIGPLLAMLDCEYYASETAMRHALEQKSCFNLIHLPTSFKVDVFVHRRRAFDEAAFARTVMFELGHEPTFAVPVASLEDTIIAKLAWFQEGGGVSERQWNDVSILMKLHGESVDSRYLRDAAIQLEVAHLLDRLLIELS